MIRIILCCLLVVTMLTLAAMAFPTEPAKGVPALQCNKGINLPRQNNEPVPYGTTNCGSYTCANDGTCCGDDTCCPNGYDIYCKNKGMCYTSTQDAIDACGQDYDICYKPVK